MGWVLARPQKESSEKRPSLLYPSEQEGPNTHLSPPSHADPRLESGCMRILSDILLSPRWTSPLEFRSLKASWSLTHTITGFLSSFSASRLHQHSKSPKKRTSNLEKMSEPEHGDQILILGLNKWRSATLGFHALNPIPSSIGISTRTLESIQQSAFGFK